MNCILPEGVIEAGNDYTQRQLKSQLRFFQAGQRVGPYYRPHPRKAQPTDNLDGERPQQQVGAAAGDVKIMGRWG